MGMKKDSVCPECGATEVMVDVRVQDLNDGFTREAELTVDGDPGAILFKETANSELKACVCARCGHVELHVADPSALWDAYKAARNRGG